MKLLGNYAIFLTIALVTSIPSSGAQTQKTPANEVLGVPPNASEEEIAKAYKALVQKIYPSVNAGDKKALEQIKLINAARDELKKNLRAKPETTTTSAEKKKNEDQEGAERAKKKAAETEAQKKAAEQQKRDAENLKKAAEAQKKAAQAEAQRKAAEAEFQKKAAQAQKKAESQKWWDDFKNSRIQANTKVTQGKQTLQVNEAVMRPAGGSKNEMKIGRVIAVSANKVSIETSPGASPEEFDLSSSGWYRMESESNGLKPGTQVADSLGHAATVKHIWEKGWTTIETAAGERTVQTENLKMANTAPRLTIYKANGRLSGRAFNAIGVLPSITSTLRTSTQQSVLQSLAKGTCPDVPEFLSNSPDAFNIATRTDIPSLESAFSDCQKKGRPMKFTNELKTLLENKKTGFSQVNCDKRGNISIVHRNGTTSKIHFTAKDVLASITTFAPDDPEHLILTYQQTESKKPWKVITSFEESTTPERREESYGSFSNRYYCLRNECQSSQMAVYFDEIDDTTSDMFPFGAFSKSHMNTVADSFVETKKALIASFLTSRSYKVTCQALGGKTPKDDEILFTDSESSKNSQLKERPDSNLR